MGSEFQKRKDASMAQFKYAAMSNLVLQADRRLMSRTKDEPTGDPESLAGHLSIRDMGSRLMREKPQQRAAPKVERGTATEGADILEREKRKRKRDEDVRLQGTSILGATETIEGLRYRPRTPATRATYDLINTIVARNLGDVPPSIVVSAADAVLEFLKDPELKDFDRKKEIDDILGTNMGNKEFNELVNLGKKITDYDEPDDDAGGNDEDGDIDEKQGIAVLLDTADTDDEQENFEVRDPEDDTDDEGDGLTPPPVEAGAEPEPDKTGEDDEMVIDSGLAVTAADGQKEEGVIPVQDIDAYWLQRQIGQIYEDVHIQQEKTTQASQILSGNNEEGEEKTLREVENDLMELFDWEQPELVAKLVVNRDRIIWVTRWRQAADSKDAADRAKVEREMIANGHRGILRELVSREEADATDDAPAIKKMKLDLAGLKAPEKTDVEMADAKEEGLVGGLQPKKLINLDSLVFDQGNHLMTNPNVKLPAGSTKRSHKGYEEIIIPAPKRKQDANEPPLIPTTDLPDWARPGFGTSKNLNRIQTKCYPAAFQSDGNMLICAPTGSGKTNVAMLSMLREIGKHRDPATGQINLDAFKIIYIAPLKALVQEQVGNFGKRLESYGIKVAELTGDAQLTKQQIAETQIIVTTPEKWDVITRKQTSASYTNLVRLICIDEIHLLHDERGPVLEAIVARTIRKTEETGNPVRLVGLSATLPNYRDVASFLRVDSRHLFHFDSSFRPCPLKQEYVGVTDKKSIKQLQTMNEVCYLKVLEHVGQNGHQMLIFVHSRKETFRTARFIRDQAQARDTIGQILRADAATKTILDEESNQVANSELKDLLSYGFGIHHAGLSRADRASVEDLFADGHIRVLVCTATLAWGVNLPAHTVLIKGTQIYSPEKGSWVELSPQDVLQMLGRAGRPQYDTYGEGIIMTTAMELQFYLSLLNQQLPIESQLMSKLADNLNAEIVLGNIRTRDEAVQWLGYTYLFVRMLRSPGLYSVGSEYDNDDALEQKRVDLIHSAATVLEKSQLVKYDKKTGKLQSTDLGKIASHYYITYKSMDTYNYHINPQISTVELFRIFALSEEFKYIPVRADEKVELAKMISRVPIPIKEGIDEPVAKINGLLQAYISRLKFEGLALMADLVYVTQSAGRILRAMFEIALKKGFASVARITLDLCKMAEKRMWPTMTPLRNFHDCPREIIQKAERVRVRWSEYFNLDPQAMADLLKLPGKGRDVVALVEKFPRLEVQAQVQPMTKSLLRVTLSITPNFTWDENYHGNSESFWILVEDDDGEQLLFHDQFILRREYAMGDMSEHLVDFTVPIAEPMPPNYFITVVSDRWMHASNRLPISFAKLILPSKNPSHTQLLDLQPLPVAALKRPDYVRLYQDKFDRFNKIQTQVYNVLYSSDDSAFVASSTGSGKTVCAEFALLRHWAKEGEDGRAVYIAPFQELVDIRFKEWEKRFANVAGGKVVVQLTGETQADLRLLEQGNLILATPTQWDNLSRTWQRRANVRTVKLLICDDLQMVGGQGGHTYEVVVSRMHMMSQQIESNMRIVGLSVSLGNANDLGQWIGATKSTIFNFSPHVRAVPLEVHIQAYGINHFPSLMLAMTQPMYQSILQMSADKPAMVFLPSRKQVRATAMDLLAACLADDDEDRFLHTGGEQFEQICSRVQEDALRESLSHGIGYYHEAMSAFDKRIVEHLFRMGGIQVLLVSRDCCWEINVNAHLVVIMGTQFFEGREHRYIDYPISEVLQMLGKAGRVGEDKSSRGILMTNAVKRDYYKRFLNEALPMESQLQTFLPDAYVTEIASKNIESLQDALDWATYTFFYRRIISNPSFYGVEETSQEGMSAFLSGQVESTMKELVEAQVIEVDEDEGSITPLSPAMIASYYSLSFVTIQTFLMSFSAKTKLKGILEVITAATEFEDIAIRRHEDRALRRIYDRIPVKMSEENYDSPHFKAFVLLQAHFSRIELPVDLEKDRNLILKRVINLLYAAVDVLSSKGHLNATGAMEISQMVVQAMWDRDSPLKQIPWFDKDGGKPIKAANAAGIKDIYGFMEAMDPEENPNYEQLVKSLGLTNEELADAANFTNDKYPNVELDFQVEDPEDIVAGEPAYLNITVQREVDEDTEEVDLEVHAPYYPVKKTENWWLVVGDEKNKDLLAIKRIAFEKELKTRLEFVVPKAGKSELTLYLMSDSYVGVDQAPTFMVDAAEGESDDEDGDEDEDMEE